MINRMTIREVKEKGGERGRSALAITITHEEEESNRLSHELPHGSIHNRTSPASYSTAMIIFVSFDIIEKYTESIPDKVIEYDLMLYSQQNEKEYFEYYCLDRIVCMKEFHLISNSHFIDIFAESKQQNFCVYKQESSLISGVYKIVSMPFIILGDI